MQTRVRLMEPPPDRLFPMCGGQFYCENDALVEALRRRCSRVALHERPTQRHRPVRIERVREARRSHCVTNRYSSRPRPSDRAAAIAQPPALRTAIRVRRACREGGIGSGLFSLSNLPARVVLADDGDRLLGIVHATREDRWGEAA